MSWEVGNHRTVIVKETHSLLQNTLSETQCSSYQPTICIIICLLAAFPTRGPRVDSRCSRNNDWMKTILCLNELAFEATISVNTSDPFISVEGKETSICHPSTLPLKC